MHLWKLNFSMNFSAKDTPLKENMHDNNQGNPLKDNDFLLIWRLRQPTNLTVLPRASKAGLQSPICTKYETLWWWIRNEKWEFDNGNLIVNDNNHERHPEPIFENYFNLWNRSNMWNLFEFLKWVEMFHYLCKTVRLQRNPNSKKERASKIYIWKIAIDGFFDLRSGKRNMIQLGASREKVTWHCDADPSFCWKTLKWQIP